ncbi:hypothetical protein NW762_006120 [Fusarium torreyae]|uniref:Uncharacterized protein n=1 Tax=Fusarium torreyae TaxID=1237075 RepID=A0A9W8VEV0_9HYPO|nr:hypothetical protein NW762_006120 [Fusarium torreyae]
MSIDDKGILATEKEHYMTAWEAAKGYRKALVFGLWHFPSLPSWMATTLPSSDHFLPSLPSAIGLGSNLPIPTTTSWNRNGRLLSGSLIL